MCVPNIRGDKKRTGDKEVQQQHAVTSQTPPEEHETEITGDKSESDSDNDSDSDLGQDVPDSEILKVIPKTISLKESLGSKDLSRLPSEAAKQPIRQ